MTSFHGWHEVGCAMFWARRQPGVDYHRTRVGGRTSRTEHVWTAPNGRQVSVRIIPDLRIVTVRTDTADGTHMDLTNAGADQILAVLADLGFLPEHLSWTYQAGVEAARNGVAVDVHEAAMQWGVGLS